MDDSATTGRRAQRQATIAALARPVQHEINNLLTVIFANLELLKRTTAEGAPQNQLDRIQQATKRLDISTRSLLNLIRRPVPEEAEVAPLLAVQALVPLLRVLLPTPTALALDLPEGDAWRAQFDRAAFDEAMIELAREAAAAMPRAASLGLALRQDAGAIILVITWPDGAAPPGEALAAALARLGATTLPDGGWELRWARLTS